ncbi:MAG: hypothetical protein WCB49_06550 [Gammaproteobacteria bacterium]
MRFRTLFTLVTLTAPAAAFALGSGSMGQAPKSAVPPFKQVDTNHDGKIEWQEAKAVHVPKKIFKQNDFSNTGKLTRSEWQFVRIEMPANKKPPSPGGTG